MAAPAPLSPLAPKTYPAMPVIEGVRFASAAAGVRYPGRTDVMMALFDEPAMVAGVFTRSRCPSAPVDWCRAQLPQARRARWSSTPATPTRLRAIGAVGGDRSRRRHRQGDGRRFQRNLLGLDRRHRRAPGSVPHHGRARRARGVREARRLDGRGARDHDDRHLSKTRDRQSRARRPRADSTASPKARA